MDKITKSDEEWRNELTEEQYQVLRHKGTEAPFTGALLHSKETGDFACAACGNILFSSDTKFDSGSGWPSFYEPKNLERVELRDDTAHGMVRTEVVCKRCGGHLGHLFDDAPQTPTGQRYCINSAALKLMPKESEK